MPMQAVAGVRPAHAEVAVGHGLAATRPNVVAVTMHQLPVAPVLAMTTFADASSRGLGRVNAQHRLRMRRGVRLATCIRLVTVGRVNLYRTCKAHHRALAVSVGLVLEVHQAVMTTTAVEARLGLIGAHFESPVSVCSCSFRSRRLQRAAMTLSIWPRSPERSRHDECVTLDFLHGYY